MKTTTKEIEKKYLIDISPDILEGLKKQAHKKEAIAQSYISYDPELRIRRSNSEYFFACKGEGLLERDEFEISITQDQYERLHSLVSGYEIIKDRYHISLEGGLNAELDIFHGQLAGHITAEVEFKCKKCAMRFIPPAWFGKDVTECKEFKNKELSKNGL